VTLSSVPDERSARAELFELGERADAASARAEALLVEHRAYLARQERDMQVAVCEALASGRGVTPLAMRALQQLDPGSILLRDAVRERRGQDGGLLWIR
jgi:hypothetical protein